MTKDLDELWEEKVQQKNPSNCLDPSDLIRECVNEWGKAYKRLIPLRSGLYLYIQNSEIWADLQGKLYPGKSWPEFAFQISGIRWLWNGNHQEFGQNFLHIGSHLGGFQKFSARQRLLKVDIHLEPCVLGSYIATSSQPIPLELKPFVEGSDEQPYFCVSTTTPAMQVALHQILNCPYQGTTRRIYLESKALELIALRLDEAICQTTDYSASDNRSGKNHVLKPSEIERIYHAQDILTQNLSNPPSIINLARQVALNEHKLKVGFRQVSNTTVFGYLHTRRMEQARMLLEESNMTITGVANAVGYANRSHFAAAFKKKFGVNPGDYLVGKRKREI